MTIDDTIVCSVLEEALSCLPAIREGVSLYRENPAAFDSLETAFRDAQSIKGAASMIEQQEVYQRAKALEVKLRDIASARAPIGADTEQALFAEIDDLEKLLRDKNAQAAEAAASAGQDLSFSIAEFDDDDDDNEEDKFVQSDEDFEIDPETLEIFSLEADDLLRNISEQLKTLARDPSNYEALMEIRRSAHTLKGSAAIVGLKPLSALAHRMEDLLDLLTEQKLNPNADVHSLLSSSADCLAAIANGDHSPELSAATKDIYLRYEVLLSLLSNRDGVLQLDLKGAAKAESSTAGEETKEEFDDIQSSEKASKNSVIRISVDRLDGLMRLFSEVLQSRAVIEQRLSDMEKQLMELQHSTGRLRNSAGKLEIDFEAGMLRNSSGAKFALPETGHHAPGDKEFDELEFDRYTEFHQVTRQLVETGSDVGSINIEMEGLLTNLESVFTHQRHLIDDIQKRLMQLRMVSFDSLARRLQRTIRMTADQEEKLIDLTIEGGSLEVDTQIIDSLMEPLLHILRNAVSHGIESPDTRKLLGKSEQGHITLRLSQEGTFIVLSVADDGRGIQLSDLREKALKSGFTTEKELKEMTHEEVLSLVFLPGLSTSTEVSEVSGRGVGMNIVKENLARYQGTVSLASELRSGTTVTLRLPMTISVSHALLANAGNEIYAFPLDLVAKVIEISGSEFAAARRENSLSVDGTSHRLIHLNELMNFSAPAVVEKSAVTIVLLKSADGLCAMAVEQLLPPQEIILKPLCFPVQNLPGLLGASILGNGKVVPVLDLNHLLKYENIQREKLTVAAPRLKPAVSVMIVDDSPSVRRIMSAVLTGGGWNVTAAKDGIEAFELLQAATELPAVILTDVEMPRMDGYELLATLKRQDKFKHIPVVIITSRAGDKHRRKALDLGVSEYVTKPYEDSVLLETIKVLAG